MKGKHENHIFHLNERSAQTNPRSVALSLDKKHGARSCNDEKEILYLGGWRSLFSRPVDSFHGTVIPGDERFPWVNKSQSRTLSTEITFHSAPPRVFPLLALFLLARFHKAISGLVSTPSLPDKDFHASIFLEDLGSIYFFFPFPPPLSFFSFFNLWFLSVTREKLASSEICGLFIFITLFSRLILLVKG